LKWSWPFVRPVRMSARKGSNGGRAVVYRRVEEVRSDWRKRRVEIERRLADFCAARESTEESLLSELAFCLLAIQTSARRSDHAVQGLVANGLLWRGSATAIARFLRTRVRFHNHKAAYLVAARDHFFAANPTLRAWLDSTSPTAAREYLVRELDGFGYKEASHFLRNVGRGEDFAILDRHVLKNLRYHGVIRTIPDSLTARRYLMIEDRVRNFSRDVRIPMAALDLVFWSRETGEVFK